MGKGKTVLSSSVRSSSKPIKSRQNAHAANDEEILPLNAVCEEELESAESEKKLNASFKHTLTHIGVQN